MAPETPDQPTGRRFGLNRFVKSASSSEETAARILAERAQNGAPGAGSPAEKLDQIADGMQQLFDLLAAVHDQDKNTNKAFDTLYAELADYKNDFFYERLKPFVRALLFLMDSIELYSLEVNAHQSEGKPLDPDAVKAQIDHIAGELRDALQLIEVAPLEEDSEEFNPRWQRAVEVVAVEAEQNNRVLKTVRPGYTMGKAMLRPADVVVGKKA